jgi:hypothetical protein
MKLLIASVALLALGLGLSAENRVVDDPPPEPVDCPMCAGNAQLHARRLVLIQERVHTIALHALRW